MAARLPSTEPIPERIVVIGCAGSGKTTLARALAVRLGGRHIERDALGDDEAPGFATQVAAAIDAAGFPVGVRRRPLQRRAGRLSTRRHRCRGRLSTLVVQRRVRARSVRLWLTHRGDGAHTSTSPPWRWWAPDHPVGWAARTHAARDTEIVELFARSELAHAHRLRFTSPRLAAVWLASLSR